MTTTTHSIRPCVAPTAPRRADCVWPWHGRPAPVPCARAFRSAFSLLELTIVLAIIVSVSAVALPRYWSSIARYRVDMAARRIAADLSLAQSKAKATGQFRNVDFHATNPAYLLPEESSLTAPAPAVFTVNLARDFISFDSCILTDRGRRLTFDGFGQPAQGLTLVLSSAGHIRIVSVDQSSGAINVTTP